MPLVRAPFQPPERNPFSRAEAKADSPVWPPQVIEEWKVYGQLYPYPHVCLAQAYWAKRMSAAAESLDDAIVRDGLADQGAWRCYWVKAGKSMKANMFGEGAAKRN